MAENLSKPSFDSIPLCFDADMFAFWKNFDVGILGIQKCLEVGLLGFSKIWLLFLQTFWQHWRQPCNKFSSLSQNKVLWLYYKIPEQLLLLNLSFLWYQGLCNLSFKVHKSSEYRAWDSNGPNLMRLRSSSVFRWHLITIHTLFSFQMVGSFEYQMTVFGSPV